jgi:hypothetical protein
LVVDLGNDDALPDTFFEGLAHLDLSMGDMRLGMMLMKG